MRYLIINTIEWKALRLACTALIKDHKVNVFLLGSGREIDKSFDIGKLWNNFLVLRREALSCDTYLRNSNGPFPTFSMNDFLVTLSEEGDVVMVFS